MFFALPLVDCNLKLLPIACFSYVSFGWDKLQWNLGHAQKTHTHICQTCDMSSLNRQAPKEKYHGKLNWILHFYESQTCWCIPFTLYNHAILLKPMHGYFTVPGVCRCLRAWGDREPVLRGWLGTVFGFLPVKKAGVFTKFTHGWISPKSWRPK